MTDVTVAPPRHGVITCSDVRYRDVAPADADATWDEECVAAPQPNAEEPKNAAPSSEPPRETSPLIPSAAVINPDAAWDQESADLALPGSECASEPQNAATCDPPALSLPTQATSCVGGSDAEMPFQGSAAWQETTPASTSPIPEPSDVPPAPNAGIQAEPTSRAETLSTTLPKTRDRASPPAEVRFQRNLSQELARPGWDHNLRFSAPQCQRIVIPYFADSGHDATTGGRGCKLGEVGSDHLSCRHQLDHVDRRLCDG